MNRVICVLAISLAVVLPGCEWLAPSQSDVVLDTGPRTVYALGRLEPASGIIDIRATPGDRLEKLNSIEENKLVPSDGVLGYLSSYSMGKAQLNALLKKQELAEEKHLQQVQLAEAQLAQATASKAQADAKQKELTLRQGKIEALKVASDLAAKEYKKLEDLQKTDQELVTQHQLDKQKNQMELAKQDYIIARDTLHAASESAALAVEAAEANIKVAATAVKQASKNFDKVVVQQEIEVAKEVLKRSVLLAPNATSDLINEIEQDSDTTEVKSEPAEYTVLKVFLREGEVVTPAPVLQLGDLRKMICIAEVYEADVQELVEELGVQGVTIRSPAFSGDFADGELDPKTNKRSGGIRGKVVRIGRMIAPPGVSNRNPLAPTDRSVVEVRIEIEDPAAIKHASKHVGLQVTVEFDAKDRATEEQPENDSPTDSDIEASEK